MNETVFQLGAVAVSLLEVALGVGLFALGLVIGALVLRRRGATAARVRELESQLDSEREQRHQYREAVSKHFDGTSDLFRDLTRNYASLYAHLAEGARELSPERVPELGRGYADPSLHIGVGEPAATEAAPEDGEAPAPAESTPTA